MTASLTFTRRWLFNANNLCRAINGSTLIQNQQNLLAIKNVFIGGAGQEGWTDQSGGAVAAPTFWVMDSSCDSVTAGAAGDGVDRWDTYTDLVWGTVAGANSWMVIKNASAITGKTLYWLWALENSGSDSRTMDMYVSKVGFGAIHGGTDGTTTARPTATDEQNSLPSTYWGANGGVPIRFHVMMSADGIATRLFTNYQTILAGVWLLEPLFDATTNLEDNLLASVWGGATVNPVGANSLTQTPQPLARKTGGPSISGVLTGEGSRYASNVQAALPNVDRVLWNDLSTMTQLTAIGAWGTGQPTRGHLGSLVDLWWGSDFVPSGQSLPDDYTRQLITMGPLVAPWNRSLPKVF